MMSLRRDGGRLHLRHALQETWQTFFSEDRGAPLGTGFGTLERFSECWMAPLSDLKHEIQGIELVTYVIQGSLSYSFDGERSGVLHAGEFQRVTAGDGLEYGERNASSVDPVRFLQLAIRLAEPGLTPGHAEWRVCDSQASMRSVVVADGMPSSSSLFLHQNAKLSRLVLRVDERVTQQVPRRRGIWIHVVRGHVVLGALSLKAGDSVGIQAESVLNIQAIAAAELLVLDVGNLP